MTTRRAVLTGLALGIGAEVLAHTLTIAHVAALLLALVAYTLALAIDSTTWST